MSNLVMVDQAASAKVETPQQYLTFSLGGEMFAVVTRCVKEIIEYGQLTTMPMMPAMIRGVLNLRGSVVPVIDLGPRFGGARTELKRRTSIVILEVDSGDDMQDIGVLVDAVSEVLEIAPADIEPTPSFGVRIRTDFMLGMGKVRGQFVILLDVGKVLSVDEISSLAGMAAQPLTAAEAS